MGTSWKAGPALWSTVCLLMLARPAEAQPAPNSGGRYASRCQDLAEMWTNGEKDIFPQSTMLWGAARREKDREMSTVLAAVKTEGARMGNPRIQGVSLAPGHLVPLSKAAGKSAPASALVGAVLKGSDYREKQVEVAICTAEPAADDSDMMWYRIQVWNALTDTWQNPCVGTKDVPHPRVLAFQGIWDATGAHHDSDQEFTFSCETGAIAKCAQWGYKPWAEHDGQSLAPMHQACTRMARADYCGNGHSHTKDGTKIDVYDGSKILDRTTGLIPEDRAKTTSGGDPQLAFEAAWEPDGAFCLARTRLGQKLDDILEECPDRFEAGRDIDLGDGDRCSIGLKATRAGAPSLLLRNRSHTPSTASAGAGNP